jgi:NAD(P)-dependent dehydrogenase (short-subunit alcohol dehydrogenase family)
MSAEVPRTSLVTGGARGIGLGIATVLARRGDDVVIGDLDLATAEASAAALRAGGHDARAIALDVTDVGDVRRAIAELDAATPLGTLVNNAGIGFDSPVADVEPADFDRLMAINVRGLFFCMQAALRAMVPRGAGSVVNVASTSSFTASTGPMILYDASKATVKMFTQAAAKEVAASGVRVNAVAPGTIGTELVRALPAERMARLTDERIPMRRLGEPEEIGEAVAFLSSPAASYVTGHVLVADGGWLT